jgi:hypothetical protein
VRGTRRSRSGTHPPLDQRSPGCRCGGRESSRAASRTHAMPESVPAGIDAIILGEMASKAGAAVGRRLPSAWCRRARLRPDERGWAAGTWSSRLGDHGPAPACIGMAGGKPQSPECTPRSMRLAATILLIGDGERCWSCCRHHRSSLRHGRSRCTAPFFRDGAGLCPCFRGRKQKGPDILGPSAMLWP